MSPRDDILAMAERQEQSALAAIEAGRKYGYDPSREALEYVDIARILKAAAHEMAGMDPASAQDYAHRLKFAVWARLDDSPEVPAHREDPL
jgi:hypothetical protein